MIRPWYRSRLFWLGLLGLVFLGWAWEKSISTRVIAHLSPSCGWVGSGHGQVLWFAVRTNGDDLLSLDLRSGRASEEAAQYFNSSSAKFAVPRFHTTASPIAAATWFPAAHRRVERLAAGTSLFASLPYWLLIAGYAAVWLGGVAYWQRHKSRLLKLHAAPPP